MHLTPSSTTAEVKRAYRILAAKYHPDLNPDGADMFLQIKEAYEILTGKIELPKASASTTSRTQTTEKKSATREERAREARLRQQERIKKEQEENLRYYQSLLASKWFKHLKIGAVICTIMAILMILDTTLPEKFPDDFTLEITDADRQEILKQYTAQLTEEQWEQIGMKPEDFSQLTIESTYSHSHVISESAIFAHKLRYKVIPTFNGITLKAEDDNSTTWPIIIFLFTPLLAILNNRMTPLFSLLYHTSNYIFIPLGYIVTLVHIYLTLKNYAII